MDCASTRSGNIIRASKGELLSLLVLSHCAVSPMLFFPQESTYISSASICSPIITCGINKNDIDALPVRVSAGR